MPVGLGIDHDLAPRAHDVDLVARLGVTRPDAARSFVGGRDPQGELVAILVDGVDTVTTPHQLAGGVGELDHDVVARDAAQEGGLTCENDLIDRRTERRRGHEMTDARVGIEARGELD